MAKTWQQAKLLSAATRWATAGRPLETRGTRLLMAWLARFHVEPRAALPEAAARIAAARGLTLTSRRGPLGYYQLHVLAA